MKILIVNNRKIHKFRKYPQLMSRLSFLKRYTKKFKCKIYSFQGNLIEILILILQFKMGFNAVHVHKNEISKQMNFLVPCLMPVLTNMSFGFQSKSCKITTFSYAILPTFLEKCHCLWLLLRSFTCQLQLSIIIDKIASCQ